MPDTIRRSGRYARPWRGGFFIAIGASLPLPVHAADQPKLVLQELVLDATRSIDRHEVAVLVLIVGAVTALSFLVSRYTVHYDA